MFYSFFSLLFLIIPIIILVAIVKNFSQTKTVNPRLNSDWYLQTSFCREDITSQLYLFLSVVFFGLTLFSVNQLSGSQLKIITILLITSVAMFIMAYFKKAHLLLFASLIGFLVWFGDQLSTWNSAISIKPSAISGIFCILFLVFYTIGRLHEKDFRWKRFGFVYTILGLIVTTASLFTLSTKSGLSLLEYLSTGKIIYLSWQLTTTLILVLILLLIVLYKGVTRNVINKYELIGLLIISSVFFFIVMLPKISLFSSNNSVNIFNSYNYEHRLNMFGVATAMFFNIMIFIELLALILLGYYRKESWLINLGAVCLFLLIIVKYFDWFFTFLDKSIFFVGAGILMFGVGWLMEKSRRYIISSIKAVPHD